MLTINRLYLSLALITVLALMPLWSVSNAQDADQGDGGDINSTEDIDPIDPSTFFPAVVVDFNDLPQGPTTLETIQNAFFPACIDRIEIAPKPPAFLLPGSGIYDFLTEDGRALALNPDNSGGLFLVDPGGTFQSNDSVTIFLSRFVTEFGFAIGDYTGGFNAEIFNDGLSVGLITVNLSSGNLTHAFESDIPFNSVVLFPDANLFGDFVVPSLLIPPCGPGGITKPIPTISEWGLIAMAGVLGIIAILAIRRKKAAA